MRSPSKRQSLPREAKWHHLGHPDLSPGSASPQLPFRVLLDYSLRAGWSWGRWVTVLASQHWERLDLFVCAVTLPSIENKVGV